MYSLTSRFHFVSSLFHRPSWFSLFFFFGFYSLYIFLLASYLFVASFLLFVFFSIVFFLPHVPYCPSFSILSCRSLLSLYFFLLPLVLSSFSFSCRLPMRLPPSSQFLFRPSILLPTFASLPSLFLFITCQLPLPVPFFFPIFPIAITCSFIVCTSLLFHHLYFSCRSTLPSNTHSFSSSSFLLSFFIRFFVFPFLF